MKNPAIGVFAMIGCVCGAVSCSSQRPPEAPHAPDTKKAVPPEQSADWRAAESPRLGEATQLTSAAGFVKAGEAYFNPMANRIIFQAIPLPEKDAAPLPYYRMFAAQLSLGSNVGIGAIRELNTTSGAETCGWFHPTDPNVVIYGSTLAPPTDEAKSGFQVGTRKYVWMFPSQMDIVRHDASGPKRLFSQENYDAECSFDPTGRFVLYAHIENNPQPGSAERHDADIYIFDTQTNTHTRVVSAPGYDGGPFFSPDGKSICYRSDREGNDLLQIFVADLAFENGVPVGLAREWQLTNNEHVNWCPYWHPSGEYLIYATSEVGHTNYELFVIESDMQKLRGLPKSTPASAAVRRSRVTHAPGADVLPSFSPDGKWLMWTSQRQGIAPGEHRASSQLWIAPWKGPGF